MPGKSVHRTRIKVQPSFPNNRRSTRFRRRKVVTKRVWKEEESPAYFGVPNTAIFTPWDIPNPTDQAPALKNYNSIKYSDAGGYTAAPVQGLGMDPGFGQPSGLPGEFNASEYLSNQFNPFVAENIPPMILDFRVDTEDVWKEVAGVSVPWLEHVWAHVNVELFDASDNNKAVISVWTSSPANYDDRVVIQWSAGCYENYSIVLSADPLNAKLNGYWVNLTVNDNSGCRAYSDIEVPGLVDIIADFLAAIWNAVVGVLKAAWEAVKAACSFLVEIVKGIVEGIINKLLQPIITAIDNWMREIAQVFLSASQYTAEGIVDGLFDLIFFSPIALAILAVIVGISVAEKITMAMTGGAASALSLVTGVISGAIIGILFTSIVEILSGSTEIQDMIPDWFDETTGWSFTIAEVAFMVELKQRVLKPIKGVEMSIWLAITSLILLGVGTAITAIGGETGVALKANILLDVFALGIALYGLKKGVEISGRGANLIKMWYPLLYPIMLILDAMGIATSVYSLITDIIKIVAPDQSSNPGGA